MSATWEAEAEAALLDIELTKLDGPRRLRWVIREDGGTFTKVSWHVPKGCTRLVFGNPANSAAAVRARAPEGWRIDVSDKEIACTRLWLIEFTECADEIVFHPSGPEAAAWIARYVTSNVTDVRYTDKGLARSMLNLARSDGAFVKEKKGS